MILQYGSAKRADAEVTLQISKQAAFSSRGYRIGTRERWDIQGVLQAASVSALTTALATLEAEYATQNQTIVLLESDGNTETQHKIDPNDTIGGVKVLGPVSYPASGSGEYTTFRRYTITVEALRSDSESALLSFRETVEAVGTGGAVGAWIPVLNGFPQLQTVSQASTQLITQSGEAVGLAAYPSAASPLLPNLEHVQRRRIRRRGPRADRTDFVEFGISWTYVFESPIPQFALPNQF